MQENLARGLSVVSRAVSSRSTLPVLANVLLKTEDAGLKLTATNLEIGITYWVPGKIESDGATTVPAKLLTDLVNSLPAGDKVDLELTAGESLHLRSGRFETHIKGIDADEFPAIQAAGERPTTRVAQDVLRKALNETTFAAASDEARPILTTDAVEIVLAGGRNQVLFHLEGVDLVSRLIDGQFPNYQQVVPKEHTTRAVLDREELLRAVRPAALIAHESANIVKFQVGGDGEAGITVSANAEVGDHVGQVEATVEGDGTTIAFNARYLADVLTNVDAEQFALELNGPLSPGVFKPVGDDSYVHVVMPVRTTS
jgi:DNA polymerase-3 subunit beta